MISYIKGIVENVESDKVIIDKDGMGFNIYMPQSDLQLLGQGEEVKIHTYFSVREDAMQLFGFLNREELNMYKLLLGVSGVGPKGGLAIISVCPGDALQMAILSGDAKTIAKAPGIGNKTAQKIIIELKDKIDIEEVIGVQAEQPVSAKMSEVQSDAIEALVTLGYSQTTAFNAVKTSCVSDDMDVEMLLKEALKHIG